LAPAKIAAALNVEGIAGPAGGLWQSSTIREHAKRQSGVQRTRAYNGQIVDGQMEFRRAPYTGKRTSLPRGSPLIVEAQDLRIAP